MADIVSKEERSRRMSGIRSKNTKPERIIRKGLHACGFRFRLHDKKLPGKPDLVLRKYNAVIFVHGCFWHGHDCHLFKRPKSRKHFWGPKIEANKLRDARAYESLHRSGWRVAEVWECALKGRTKQPLENVIQRCATWLKSSKPDLEIIGSRNDHDAK
jgi:DNA mismatch endonuclease (patch repair protein)